MGQICTKAQPDNRPPKRPMLANQPCRQDPVIESETAPLPSELEKAPSQQMEVHIDDQDMKVKDDPQLNFSEEDQDQENDAMATARNEDLPEKAESDTIPRDKKTKKKKNRSSPKESSERHKSSKIEQKAADS